MKYFVKSFFQGWREVSKERYDNFRKNILEHSTPPNLTRQELADKMTRVEME